MNAHVIRSALFTVTVLAVSGCAGVGDNFKAPDVQLNHVVVRGIGLTGGTLDLVVNVYNPNDFILQGKKMQVGFDVENSHVGDITYNEDFAVTKQDTTRVTLPLKFEWSGISGAVRAALGYGDIPYTMKGVAELETPFGTRKVPFTRSGRAPLTRAGGAIGVPGKSP